MSTKKSVFRMFIVLLVIVMMTSTASARPLEAALGTGFTYQGKLTDGGSPANGAYDFEFKLYDDPSVSSQVGITVPKDDVTVTAGLFTVQLDFGNVFDGTALYLEIGVRPGASGGAYTALTPRQQLTATPYAIYAAKVPWSGITGKPAGFASYQNVVVVAKSGGDFTTITAALASITAAGDASDTNHYLIKVAPGTYNEQVTMKEFVDIEGSGELTTKITSTGSDKWHTGTLVGANNAELRFLTVENTGKAEVATAIANYSAAPRLTHVTASASGGLTFNVGVSNGNSSATTMTDVTAKASGGSDTAVGVQNNDSSPTMTNVTATASGGANANFGVANYTSSPTMRNVTATASGGSSSSGVRNVDSSPTMSNVTATASGGTLSNSGVFNQDSSSPMMIDVIASSSGGVYSNGVINRNSSSPTMTNITATASGGMQTYGVINENSSPTMTNVTATASGTAQNSGVSNNNSSPTMENVTATASGGTDTNTGVWNEVSSSPTMTNVTASGTGGTWASGVANRDSSSPTMTNVTATASGGTTESCGVTNGASSPTINNSVISASGGTENYGICNKQGPATMRVNNSQISGSTSTVWSVAGTTVLVGASQLSGGAVIASGTITCAGVYDEDYTFYPSACP
jgi:hypothetical protein